jgi:23S rRNA (pseudouridine1915-N3)-methyltransferase
MKLELYAIGKLKQSPILSLIQDYQTRITGICRGVGFKHLDITQIDSKKNLHGNSLKQHEAELLLHNAPDIIIALDETGQSLSSHAFANLLDNYKNQGHNGCRFIIGGADGLCDSVKKRATNIISFGALTWPHMLVRVMIAEQIYRAMTILSNHPYHRGDDI